ncbi:hypothetical protein ACHAXT_000578 [Thalassiosira profunda]
MTRGTCSNCGREAEDLKKCTGACGGDAMYCHQRCQKQDWSMHQKICPRGSKVAQPLTFVLPSPDEGLPEVPVRAVRRMDGYCGSGVTLMYSDHLGVERLVPFALRVYTDDEDEALETARWMADGNAAYEQHVTSPVNPEVMKLKPHEAAFNISKYPEAYQGLLSRGIITDTGKRVQIGLYPEKFPICRIHAPQTEHRDMESIERERQAREEMFAKMGVTTLRMGC